MEKAGSGMFLSQQQQRQPKQQGYSSIDFTLLDRPTSDSAMAAPPASNGHHMYAGDYSAFRSSAAEDHRLHGDGTDAASEGHNATTTTTTTTRYMAGAYYNPHAASFLQKKATGVRDFFNEQGSSSFLADAHESHGNGQPHYLFPQSNPAKETPWDTSASETRSFLQDALRADDAGNHPSPSPQAPFSNFHNNSIAEARHPMDNGASRSSPSPSSSSWQSHSQSRDSTAQYHRDQNGRYPPFSAAPSKSDASNVFQEQLIWRAGPAQLGFGQEPRSSSVSKMNLHVLQQQALQAQKQQQQALQAQRQQNALEYQRQQQPALDVQRQQQQQVLESQRQQRQEDQRQQHQQAHESQRQGLEAKRQQQQQALESQRQQQKALEVQRQQQQQALESQWQQQKALEFQRQQQQQALESQRQQHQAFETQRQQQLAFEAQMQQQQQALEVQRQQQQTVEAQRQQQKALEEQRQQQKALEEQRQQQKAMEAQRQQQQQQALEEQRQQKALEYQRQQQKALEDQKRQQQALEFQRQQQKVLEYQRQLTLEMEKQQMLEMEKQQGLEMQKQHALDARKPQILEAQTFESKQQQNLMLQNFQTTDAQQQPASWGQPHQVLWNRTQPQRTPQESRQQSLLARQQQTLQAQQQQTLQAQQKPDLEAQMQKHAFIVKQQHGLQESRQQTLLGQQQQILEGQQQQISQAQQKQDLEMQMQENSFVVKQQHGMQAHQSQNLHAQQQSFPQQKALQAQHQQGSRAQNDQSPSLLGSQGQLWQALQSQQHDLQSMLPEQMQVQEAQNRQVKQQLKPKQFPELPQQQILPDFSQMIMQSHQNPIIQSQLQPSMQSQQQFHVQPEQQIALLSQQRPVNMQHFDGMFQQRPEHSKQQQIAQEPHLEFPVTTFSDLLHRPDTPPSQTDLTGQMAVANSDQGVAFPAVNSWTADRHLHYQVSDNFAVAQNSRLPLPVFSEDPPLITCNVSGSVQTCSSEIQDLPSHQLNSGWRLSLNDARLVEFMVHGRHAGSKESNNEAEDLSVNASVDNEPQNVGQHVNSFTILQPEQPHQNYHASQQRTDGQGTRNVVNVENGDKSQLHSKLPVSQYMFEEAGPRKTVNNGVYTIHPLLQSQQYFQSLQQNQGGSQGSVEQNQNDVSPYFTRLGNGTPQSLQIDGDKFGRKVDNPVLQHRSSYSPAHGNTGPGYNQNSSVIGSSSIAVASAPHQEVLESMMESGLKKKGTINPASEFPSTTFLVPGGHRPGSSEKRDLLRRCHFGRDGTFNIQNDDPQNCNGGETLYGPTTVKTKLYVGNDQDAGRQVYAKQFSVLTDINQETHKKMNQGDAGNRHSSNFLDVLGRQTNKLIVENQVPIHNRKHLADQNSEDKQREVLQQRVDPGIPHNHQRYPLSPQHVKLGLESTLPQIHQQSDKLGWGNFSHDKVLAEDVPITSSIAGNFHSSSPGRNFMQSTPTSNLSSRSLISRECSQPKGFPQNLASLQGLATKPINSPSNVLSEIDPYPQRETRMNDSFSSGCQLAHVNSKTFVGVQQKPSTSFTSGDSAAGFSGQQSPALDSLHEVRNQHILRKALKDLETREQARDSLVLSINLKRSLPEQPRTFGIQEKVVLGSVNSQSVKSAGASDAPSDASKGSPVAVLGRISNDAQAILNSNNRNESLLGVYNTKRRTNQEEASDDCRSAVRKLSSERPLSVINNCWGSSMQGRLSATSQNNIQISNADYTSTRFKVQANKHDISASAEQQLQSERKISEDATIDVNWSARSHNLLGDSPVVKVSVDKMNPRIARQSVLERKEPAQNSSSPNDPVKYQPETIKQSVNSPVASSYKEKSNDLVSVNADKTAHLFVNNPPPSSQGLRFFVSAVRDSSRNQFDQAQSHGKTFTSLHNSLTSDHVGDESCRNQVTSCLEDSVNREAVDESSEKSPVIMPSHLPLKRNSFCMEFPQPKRKKRQVPFCIPWHLTTAQPTSNLLSTGEMEQIWTNALNRVPEKDYGSLIYKRYSSEESLAKRRLKLTSQLMQQIILPLTCGLINGNTHADYECAIYTVSKLALADACRLVTTSNINREAGFTDDRSDSGKLCLHRAASLANAAGWTTKLMENVKLLDEEITRVESVTTLMELKAETDELEKMSIVNRFMRRHDIGCTKDTLEYLGFDSNISDIGPGFQKPAPQKYVTVVPFPRTSLQYARCLSL